MSTARSSMKNALFAILALYSLPDAPRLSAQESPLRLIRTTEAMTPMEEAQALHVPEGFGVGLFASEPMINKPINMAFDSTGRLWVSSTIEYPFCADKARWSDAKGTKIKDSQDAIKILEDTNGDGKADKVTVFADGLNIPTGVLPWHKPEDKSGCIAWSIPNIWYFADTDGDGVCDKREVLFGPLGYEKDTHGMCSSFRLGLDGWVYATHGFNNTSHIKVLPEHCKPGEKPDTLDLHSGNVFRFRPDGSHVEIWSWGQVNPFGLCWDRNGNLYSADCHSNPLTQLIRGAYYPSFGKPHDGLGYGPVMCQHTHGSTGLCGVLYIDGGVWGPEWDDHMILGNCVTSKINHDKITFTGSTPTANEGPDFVTSDDPWFRPVDLQLGPDNALYIADFYNKIIGHYEVPLDHPGRDKERGRIWRVAKQKKPTIVKQDPDPAVKSLRKATAYGFNNETSREAVIAALGSESPQVQRWAVSALQAWPAKESLSPLIQAMKAANAAKDLSLEHSIKIALREHLKLPGSFTWLTEQERPLILDIAKSVPTTEAAAYLLQHSSKIPDASLLGIIARNADEQTLAAAIAAGRKQFKTIEAAEAVTAVHNGIMERGGKPPIQLIAWATEVAETLLAAQNKTENDWEPVPYASHPNSEMPWCVEERKCSDGQVIKVLSSLNKELKSPEKLTGVLRSKAFAASSKLGFWICGHRGFPQEPANELNLVRLIDAKTNEVLYTAFPPRTDVCQHIEWDLTTLTNRLVRFEVVDGDAGKSYAWLGVGRFESGILKVENFKGEAAMRKQLRQVADILKTSAPANLRDRLKPFLPVAAAAPVAISPEERTRLDALIASRVKAFGAAKPDASKGALVFTANCALCHQVKGQGGTIGPQLDGIGNRGIERLSEDVLDPNRNVDAHFQLHTMKLLDNSELTGFVRGEVGQVYIIVDPAGQERRVSKNELKEDKTTGMSLMPPVFGQTLPEADFFDLMSFLLTKT